MGKLVAVYGDQVELEEALSALQDAGLADKARVVGDGYSDVSEGRRTEDGAVAGVADPGAPGGAQPGERILVPPAAMSSGSPPASPAVLAPVVMPSGRARAGVVGDAPSTLGIAEDLETLTGGNAEEARHYADVISGGGSLLVVEGDASELDRSEDVLRRQRGGQGMVRR